MDLALEELEVLETPTLGEFFTGFAAGLAAVGASVAIAGAIVT